MGCCASKIKTEQDIVNLEIEKYIYTEKKDLNEFKILLLGTGESGKSTMVKQMKIIYNGGFDNDDVLFFEKVIYSNLIRSMKLMLTQLELSDCVFDKEYDSDLNFINNFELDWQPYNTKKSDIKFDSLKRLWESELIKEIIESGDTYHLLSSTKYLYHNIDRIGSSGYIPTNEDILAARYQTTGINETHFYEESSLFKIIDVGGQRNERKKWIHCFDDVSAILFLVSLSEYDQFLEEDITTNRMHEALNLFQSLINIKYFQNTNVILFLNKVDIFKEKIKKVDIQQSFPDYKSYCTMDNDEYLNGAHYFKTRFEQLNQCKSKLIYTHFTTATDTNNIKVVMCAVRDTLMQNNLKQCGLL